MLGRLAEAATRAPALEARIAAVLGRRLRAHSDRPIAVALSGGGDSVALLLAAAPWAKAHARRLLVLTVDHGLRSESRDWTFACAARAEGLGLDFRALPWRGEKPATGLPAAARAARHRLLADAAREVGAQVILMGHTADDILEAEAMRAAGGAVPSPREWSLSPAWPEGRGVFLFRPMLGLRRGEIRAWLKDLGETWVDDPANDDPTYARARARRALADASTPAPPSDGGEAAGLARMTQGGADGALSIGRRSLGGAGGEGLARYLSAACLCAAGGERPAIRVRVQALARRLGRQEAFVASLAGARIEADAETVRFMREAGEARRSGGLAPLRLAAGAEAVWDGRFAVTADRDLDIRPLAGRARMLTRQAQAALRAVTPGARPALPAVMEGGYVLCPVLEAVAGVTLEPLTLARLQAACGMVTSEP